MSLNTVESLNDLSEDEIVSWGNCSCDILLYMFKYLDVKALINCMLVNKLWKDAVDYYCERYRLWQKLVEEGMTNGGITYKQKSNLTWRDMVHNFILWQNVNLNNRSIHIKHHQFEYVKCIYMYKGNIVVGCEKGILYFDAKTFKLEKESKKSTLDLLTHEETDAIKLQIWSTEHDTSKQKFSLRSKLHLGTCLCSTDEILVTFDVLMHKLQSNNCYILDTKNIIWQYKIDRCSCIMRVIAKYHGQRGLIACMHVHEDKIYILLRNGVIMHVDADSRMFEKISHIDVPINYLNTKLYMFHRHSVVFNENAVEKNCCRCRGYLQDEGIVLACSGLSCATEHGDVLFLGYKDGMIEIYLINKLLRNTIEPELEIRLDENLLSDSDLKVLAIEVFEDLGKHNLFVATACNIYQILLK